MKQDEYGEVANDEATYQGIAEALRANGSVFIGWTDGPMTHLDILFTKRPVCVGSFQRGIRCDDLFVSIMGVGAYGFEIREHETHEGYYSGKYNNFLSGETGVEFARLVNEVKKRLSV